jgi:hypothetical protein
VGNLPSTLLEDFVITARHLVVMLVVGDCVITATTSGVGHVWACSILGEGACVDTLLTHE